MKRRPSRLPVALFLFASACSTVPAEKPAHSLDAVAGEWRGVLLSVGGDLPFRLRVRESGTEPPAVVINGEAEVPIEAVSRRSAATYVFRFAGIDSEIVAKLSPGGDALSGYWRFESAAGVVRMPFSATAHDARLFQRNDPRVGPASPAGIAAVPEVSGSWSIGPAALSGEGLGTDPRPAELLWLVQEGERVTGRAHAAAFGLQGATDAAGVGGAPDLGSSLALEGIYRNGLLRLSRFDGARATLVHARAMPDGSIAGDAWEADQTHRTWTASRAR